MLNFREITLADRETIHNHLYPAAGHGSEYSFANLLLWGEQYIAVAADTPLFFSRFGSWNSYLFPLSGSLPEMVELLRSDARQRGIPLVLFGLTAEDTARLEAVFPGQFTFRPERDSFDYVYDIERLTELHGKKLQAKRNHCNRFEADFPEWRVLPLTRELLPRCRAFTEAWYRSHYTHNQDYSGERRAISKAFEYFNELHMEGIVLETSEGVVAFSMGNRIHEDTFDVNFEKARADINGAYPMVNREFARRIHEKYPQIRFLNREDDMGIAGLRQAKESYFPDILLEKSIAEEKQ